MTIKLRRRPLGDSALLGEAEANIPPLLKRLYVQRGVCSVGELERGARGLLAYHPLTGIEQAVELMVDALQNQRRLMVIGDFDADGATSTALTVLALRQMGAKNIDFLVPNRFENGYGLSPEVVEQAAARGAQVILTVDNGISSHAGVALAHEKDIPVLITDHHSPGDTLPAADAIVNPKLRGCPFASKSLAGVGVAFYLMLALRARLNDNGWFKQQGIAAPKLAELLDLVALGTVADVVPLDANNRILVHQGLSRIRGGRCRPGIRALAEVSNRDLTRLCASDLGFALGPRLNAAGRLEDMSVGVVLLMTDELSQARMVAAELDTLNQTRRKIEQDMEAEALVLCQTIARNGQTMPFGLAIYNAEWHQGVVGILASRIKERFHRPVIAFAPAGDGVLKGSGRSVTGLHMRDLLEHLDTSHPGLMLKFGGHAMAAGLTLELTQFDRFRQRFAELVDEWLDPAMLEGVILSDGELTGPELSLTTAELLRDGGPWGQTFPDPLFDGRFRVLNQRVVGEKHLKLLLEPLAGGPMLDGIAFNIDSCLWPDNGVHTVELAYKLELKNERLEEVNAELEQPDVWNAPARAQALSKERSSLEVIVDTIDKLTQGVKNVSGLLTFAEEEDDEETFLETQSELDGLEAKLSQLEYRRMFSAEYDSADCYMDIQAGSGGTDAQDWASMLLRMYLRWAESRGFKTEIIEESEGEVAGIKSVTIKVIGDCAYGWLRTETGVHRLVRKSPFDFGGRRHTSFSSVFVYPEVYGDINIEINPADLRIDVYRASGAGGQHVNRTESAVRITHLPTNIVTQCQNDRSQHKNKDQAIKQLKAKLYEFEVQKKNAEKQALEDTKPDIGWGRQIRSYVLDDSRIKDLRTGVETRNTQSVLNGDLDKFIEASLNAGL